MEFALLSESSCGSNSRVVCRRSPTSHKAADSVRPIHCSRSWLLYEARRHPTLLNITQKPEATPDAGSEFLRSHKLSV